MVGTILSFKGVHDYCRYWDAEIEKAISENNVYGKYILTLRQRISKELSRGQTQDNEDKYGKPVPSSLEDAMDRKEFQNLPLFEDTNDKLKELLSELEKISEGIMPKDVIKATDLEAGIFSLERALMMPFATPSLYCEKDKKYYLMKDGEPMYDKNGNHLKDKNGKLKFKIKSNGCDAVLEQLVNEEGRKKFTSGNKKSYLIKTKVPRPDRLVRLFVLTGANAGYPTFYAGLSAVVTAIYLESKGYAVRITGVLGTSMTINYKGKNQSGTRFCMIDLKAYDETMDTLSLLYILADSSFFRIRQFMYYIAQQSKYEDVLNTGLGSMPSEDVFETMLSDKIKARDLEQEKDVLYYYFGGLNIVSVETAKTQITKIICKAEAKNRDTLEKLGFDFSAVATQPVSSTKVVCP